MADLRKLKDRAAELTAKGKLEKAVLAWRDVVSADPKDLASRQRLAEVLRRAGHTSEAVATYGAVADRFAHDGLLIKAIAVCKTILELEPGHAATQDALADLYAKRAAAEGARPPPRQTLMMAAVRVPASEDRNVELPLARPTATTTAAPTAIATALPTRPPVRVFAPPPAPARQGDGTTAFAAIVSAARAGADEGAEADLVIDIETVEDDLGGLEFLPDEPLAAEPAPVPIEELVVPLEVAPQPEAPPPPQRAIAPALPRVPIFSDLGRDAFLALTAATRLVRLAAGESVLREGEEGTAFYVVASGTLTVSKRDHRGADVPLARLREGDFFGEMALLAGTPRAATVAADSEAEVLELAADDLRALARKHPHLVDSLRRFYRQRLLANAMATGAVFRPFEKAERKLVMQKFRSREVRPGDVIVREGDRSDGLYVVLEGAVDVTKRKDGLPVLVGQLREGDVFGEMSCLRKTPAAATVTVKRGGTLLRLPRPEFDALVTAYPQILELVAELTEERSEHLDAILAGRAMWTEDGLVLV